MFCCIECFDDAEIRAIINGYKTTGNCDFCSCNNVYVYEIGKDQIIAELFDGLLDIYTPISDLPDGFPKDRTDLIGNILQNDWRIFKIPSDRIYELLTALCTERYKEQAELFDNPIGINNCIDRDYLEKNSILKNNSWSDFVEGIKRKNRFHSDYINTEQLITFLKCARKTYKAGEIFFRSRICPNNIGYPWNEMGPPPESKAVGGRVNPSGIGILYLSNSIETTFYEIRAGIYDYVTVGSFELLNDIDVINLADIDRVSPFIGVDYAFDFVQYATNIEHLKMIGQEIAKPLRNDNILDYLPTQYISDYIRSKDYDGIEYKSTMCSKGFNLAVFNDKFFKCISTNVYEIKSINYEYDQIK